MSSLTEPRFDVLPPRRESPRPSVVERMRDGGSTPRCSIDHPRQSSEASSSRRPSIHQSPTSIASSSHRQHEDQYLNEERNGWHGEGSGRLPRITTSNVDRRDGENGDDDGPRSAPVNSPRLYDGTNGSNGPIRSSSSPDPMISRNPRNPQSNSPVERGTSAAEGPPILGSPYSPSGQRRPSPSDIPPHPIPPRMSFHFDPQDRVGNSQTSRSSLSESGSGTDTPTQFADAPGALSPSSTPRSGRRGEPTYCGQCGQLVHGQFVRAMRKVYHLNCFRCKVSQLCLPKPLHP
jgi:hypothetical protein